MKLRSVLLASWLAVAASAYGWSPSAEADTQVFVTGARAGGYLGVGVAEITAERAKALSLKEEHGVEITRVEDDGPAAKAGIRVGDVVLQYNGQRVEGIEQFMRLVRETPTGRQVTLSISRAGAPQTVAVRTGARKAWSFRSGEPLRVEVPNLDLREFRLPGGALDVLTLTGPRLGIEGHSLGAQLADYFGVKQGVLVSSVQKGSAAERAGIRAGDVIVKVDEQLTAGHSDIRSALRGAAAASKRSVPVVVSREKREVTLTVAVEEPERPERVRAPRLLYRGGTV
jgi:serine protease Do